MHVVKNQPFCQFLGVQFDVGTYKVKRKLGDLGPRCVPRDTFIIP